MENDGPYSRTRNAPSCHLLGRAQLIAWTVVILSAWRRLSIPCVPHGTERWHSSRPQPLRSFHRNGEWYVHSMEMQTGADSLTLTLNLNKPLVFWTNNQWAATQCPRLLLCQVSSRSDQVQAQCHTHTMCGKKVTAEDYLLFSQQPLGIYEWNFSCLRDYPIYT